MALHQFYWQQILKAPGMVIIIIVLLTQSIAAQHDGVLPTPRGNHLLFFLQRNPDVNTVIYALNFKSDGTIDKENPIKGSWIRYTEKGKPKELTLIEQKFAYGVKCKALVNDEFEIRLVAYKKLPLYLKRSGADNEYRIFIKDEGKDLLLKRVFLRVNGGSFWFPKVKYMDLITTSSASGIEMLKRIDI